MSDPLISCIVPVYNGATYLAEAIDSIFAQSYTPVEVLVVDDGSTDATPEVIAGYGDRIRSLRQENAGPAAARNRGLAAARGELIAFLDADDLWHPDKLRRQLDRLRTRSEVGISLTMIQNFWIEALSHEAERRRGRKETLPVPGYVSCCMLARREVFERVGPFEAGRQHAEHVEWFARARAAGIVDELLPEVLVYRRIHHGNRSRHLAQQSRDEHLALLKSLLDARRAAAKRGPAGSEEGDPNAGE
jgi:glycosyltransferase involved in cell wall biosynthesis